jgi:hypothetical protein
MVLQAAIEAERAKTQAAIQEERVKTQALPEERDRQAAERESEERTARLMEEERNQNDAGQRALYELIVVSFFCILAKSCT